MIRTLGAGLYAAFPAGKAAFFVRLRQIL